ncbi:MAG: DegT/DnrJ/EryC1/StrS family aminotransferase [Candidatus Acidiferrales bacterium]
MRTRPFASWPQFSEDEIAAAASVLRSGKVNYWTGEEGSQFEKEFAAFTNCNFAVAVANGTVALELGLYALGIQPGDEVIVPSRTFIATASCVLSRGAVPVFADVDASSGNLTAETVRDLITPRTRAVIAVHLAGWPCEMDPLMKLARSSGLKLIEDCAQAHGATYKGRPVGSFGDAAAFSFCQDKIISTGGEGGMLTTQSEEVWRRAWSYKDHGKSFDAVYTKAHPPGFRWLHEGPGTNWRMTEMQSAIGRILLRKIPERLARRRRNTALLSACFSQIPALRVAEPSPEFGHAFYKYYVYLRPERLKQGWNLGRILEAILAEGIPCTSGSCSEIYLEVAIPHHLRPRRACRIAQELGKTSLMFQVHQTLSDEEILDTCEAVKKVMAEVSQESPRQIFSHALR